MDNSHTKDQIPPHAHCKCMYTVTGCQNNHYQNCRICGDYKDPMTHTNEGSWESKLKELEIFGEHIISVGIRYKYYLRLKEIKSFIAQEITQAKREVLDTILDTLKQPEMRTEDETKGGSKAWRCYAVGCNVTLDMIVEYIESYKSKNLL